MFQKNRSKFRFFLVWLEWISRKIYTYIGFVVQKFVTFNIKYMTNQTFSRYQMTFDSKYSKSFRKIAANSCFFFVLINICFNET